MFNDKIKEEMKSLTKLSTSMTEKRIQLLEAEDFVWDALAYAWELQFYELCTFVKLNGHAVIQEQRGGAYDPLARDGHHRIEIFIKETSFQIPHIRLRNYSGVYMGFNPLHIRHLIQFLVSCTFLCSF